MDSSDSLQRELKSLSRGVRIGVAVVITAFCFQGCVVLFQAPSFSVLFDSFGAELPPITILFLRHSATIAITMAILGVLAIVCLFAARSRSWPIPVGIAVAVVSILVAQLAIFAFQIPLNQLICKLAE